jgi:hypothetical protein
MFMEERKSKGAVAQVAVQFWLQELRQPVMVPSMQPWQNRDR